MKHNIIYSAIFLFVIWVLCQPRSVDTLTPSYHSIPIDIDTTKCLSVIEPYNTQPKTVSIIPTKFESINVQKLPKNVDEYINKYKSIAINEMKKYGIPASITLAQGLLESNIGKSELSRKYNNHFGIKCKSNYPGKCVNYHDDDPDDMFRVFNSAKESYREHSILLTSDRYKSLKKYGKNYVEWSYGLKKCGYATDKKYPEKLIKIIKKYRLHEYDK
jgi:flagellum-specific peptidoglycan hydrolase FlgJ